MYIPEVRDKFFHISVFRSGGVDSCVPDWAASDHRSQFCRPAEGIKRHSFSQLVTLLRVKFMIMDHQQV